MKEQVTRDSHLMILKVSGHALNSVMTRWGIPLVEVRSFLEERVATAVEVALEPAKKRRENELILVSGDARIISVVKSAGLEIVTVKRMDEANHKMYRKNGLRRNIR